MANADRGAIHHRALFRRYRDGAARAAARYNYAARAAEEGGRANGANALLMGFIRA